MSRYFHVVEAEQVEISDAGVLPQGMQWVRDRWVYVTPYGMLWPRSGDWIVTDQNGRAAVLRDEEFQRVYVPCSQDASRCRERWAVTDAPVRAKVLAAERAGAPREAQAGSANEAATTRQHPRRAWHPVLRGPRLNASQTPATRQIEEVDAVAR